MEEESTAASSNGIISPTTARACGKSFTNVNPDLVIFLGAYDTNYDWSDARRESVRYTADLTNLLSGVCIQYKMVVLCTCLPKLFMAGLTAADIHETEPASVQKLSGDGDPAGRKYLQELP